MAAEMKKTAHHQLTDEELKRRSSRVWKPIRVGRKPTGAAATAMLITALGRCFRVDCITRHLSPSASSFSTIRNRARFIWPSPPSFGLPCVSLLEKFATRVRASARLGPCGLSVPAPPICSSSYSELAARPGQPTTWDLVVAVLGMALLLEAARRALGLPMVILAPVFIVYIFGGPMPDLIATRGASLQGHGAPVADHRRRVRRGAGVSSGFIFLFVLSAPCSTAGAGKLFHQERRRFARPSRRAGQRRGAVASAATGGSGSSIANVVTTGTFTIR